jgi:beta-lactam-binding protein with PASTA domain/serine/threonine protein kinase
VALSNDDALVGRVLHDRYVIRERIARGGMASVFKATDQRLDREVAVKVMHQGLGEDHTFVDRFVREAKSAAKLNHPNVVAVFDQGTDGEVTYLVMEYVPGQTLRDVMRAEAPIAPGRALALIEQVLIALSAAHQAKIVHRDVKPENVLITPTGVVKVADFGLARAVSAATTATGGTLIGTVSYLAPEIVTNDGTDARSDIYAVGAMLYEMLTGIKPHTGETPIQVAYKHVHEDIGAPSLVQRGIPPYVDALVLRSTVRDRDMRSPDARVMLQQVRLVQRALAAGLDDDPELVADLLPGSRPGDEDEPTVSVSRSAMGFAEAEPTVAVFDPTEGAEPTRQWSNEAPAAPISPASTPAGLHPQMTREQYGQARLRPSRRGRLALTLCVVGALLAGLLTWYITDLRYEQAPVLTGTSFASARDQAKADGFTLSKSREEFSETVKAGNVISTTPKAGEKILPGDVIEAVVSKGPDRVFIPEGNFKGLKVSQTRKLLEKQDLVLGKRTNVYDDSIAKGRVIRATQYTSKDPLKRGTSVDITVSRGRKPIAVKNFVGRSLDEARTALQDAGFKVNPTEAFSDTVDEGLVIAQNPDGGKAFKDDTITLTVSKGPERIAVPDVTGKPRDEARRILRDAGFRVRVFGGDGDVLIQRGGKRAPRGTRITIWTAP